MTLNEIEKQLAYEHLERVLPTIITNAEYSELYGYDLLKLANSENDTDRVILERLLRKFLQANNYDTDKAGEQLSKTLVWRKEFNPLSAAFLETHVPELEKLGIVTSVVPQGKSDNLVTTWNLYGAVKNREALFGDLDGFLRWRVALMEKGISLLDFTKEHESSMTQVHDYFDVSFFRMDSSTKAATKATIQLLQDHYPESLHAKYFVNIPTIMSWVFAFVKPFLSKETVSKFHVLADGKSLGEDIGNWVPKSYGGKGGNSLDDIKVKEFKPRDGTLVDKKTAIAVEDSVTTVPAPVAPEGEDTVDSSTDNAEESETKAEAIESTSSAQVSSPTPA